MLRRCYAKLDVERTEFLWDPDRRSPRRPESVHVCECRSVIGNNTSSRRSVVELASAGLLRLLGCLYKPTRPCSWVRTVPFSGSHYSTASVQVHVVKSMKQRGIASFFGGGKAENPPRAVKVASVKPEKALTPGKTSSPEVLKDVNTSGTKRPREVITHIAIAPLTRVGNHFCHT